MVAKPEEPVLNSNQPLSLSLQLMLRNESTKKIQVENICQYPLYPAHDVYFLTRSAIPATDKDSEESRHNVEVFSTAPNLAAARDHLRKVSSSSAPGSPRRVLMLTRLLSSLERLQVPGSRFTEKYLASRYSSSSNSYKPAVPSRPVGTTIAESAPTVTIGGPSPSAALSTPASPPSRQVLSDFKAFGASPSTGVFGAPVLGSSPAAGAFRGSGGMARGGGGGGDSDDDDDGTQRIGFEEGAISFDQVSLVSRRQVDRT